MLDRFAVIGNPISHSLSPQIHHFFAEQTGKDLVYLKLAAEPPDFQSTVIDFFEKGGKGLNITAPFKQAAFSLAQVKHSRCSPGNAANTLWLEEGMIHADNTDGFGLIKDLSSFLNLENKNILLLGAGGAARSVIASLLQAKIAKLTVTNRTYTQLETLQLNFPQIQTCGLEAVEGSFDLIINATSAHLTNNGIPSFETWMPQLILKPNTYCYDLSYSTSGKMTAFVSFAYNQQCMARDGLGTLIEQAAESFRIWHGIKPDTENLIESLRS